MTYWALTIAGFSVGFLVGWDLCFRRMVFPDAIGEGVRKQVRSIQNGERFVGKGEDWRIENSATLTTAEGDTWDIIVRRHFEEECG